MTPEAPETSIEHLPRDLAPQVLRAVAIAMWRLRPANSGRADGAAALRPPRPARSPLSPETPAARPGCCIPPSSAAGSRRNRSSVNRGGRSRAGRRHPRLRRRQTCPGRWRSDCSSRSWRTPAIVNATMAGEMTHGPHTARFDRRRAGPPSESAALTKWETWSGKRMFGPAHPRCTPPQGNAKWPRNS